MSSNKVDNKLDFRNVKQTQLDPGQTLKGSFSEMQSALRTYNTNAILKEGYTHFIQTTNAEGYPTQVDYWQASQAAKDKLTTSADVAGNKAGTYFALQEYITKKVHVFYYVVSGVGVAPGIGDIETPINIIINDTSSLVARATDIAINAVEEFSSLQPSLLAGFLEIEYLQFGEVSAIDVGTSGFLVNRLREGTSFKVGEVCLDYDVNGSPIYGGNTLKGLLFNPFTASFDVERDEIEVTATVNLAPLISKNPTIYNVAMAVSGTEYSQVLPLGTKKVMLSIRDHLGKYTVGWDSAGAVITKSPGSSYEKDSLEIVTGKDTIYFTGTKNNITMEIEIWE